MDVVYDLIRMDPSVDLLIRRKKVSIKLSSGFEIVRFSDLAYEEMTIEIQYKGEQIAQLNKDKGVSLIEIEILTDFVASDFLPKFLLDDFLVAVTEAKKLLSNDY
jgi:hypothetical protein